MCLSDLYTFACRTTYVLDLCTYVHTYYTSINGYQTTLCAMLCMDIVRTYIHNMLCVPLVLFRYHESKAEEPRPILNVSQLNYASVAIVTLIILMAGIESGRNTDTSSTYVSVSLYCNNAVSKSFYNIHIIYVYMLCSAPLQELGIA